MLKHNSRNSIGPMLSVCEEMKDCIEDLTKTLGSAYAVELTDMINTMNDAKGFMAALVLLQCVLKAMPKADNSRNQAALGRECKTRLLKMSMQSRMQEECPYFYSMLNIGPVRNRPVVPPSSTSARSGHHFLVSRANSPPFRLAQ